MPAKTKDQVIGELTAMASDDLYLQGEWPEDVANLRCARYADLVETLVEMLDNEGKSATLRA